MLMNQVKQKCSAGSDSEEMRLFFVRNQKYFCFITYIKPLEFEQYRTDFGQGNSLKTKWCVSAVTF